MLHDNLHCLIYDKDQAEREMGLTTAKRRRRRKKQVGVSVRGRRLDPQDVSVMAVRTFPFSPSVGDSLIACLRPW